MLPPQPPPKEIKPPAITSVETRIMAIRGFKCILKCIDCRNEIDLNQYSNITTKSIITCPFCSTSFMADSSPLKNECDLMLSINKDWVTATSKVSTLKVLVLHILSHTKSSSNYILIIMKSNIIQYNSIKNTYFSTKIFAL